MMSGETTHESTTVSERGVPNWSRFEVGAMIPEFRLPSIDGARMSPQDFKGRQNLVILHIDAGRAGDWEVLWELSRRYKDFREQNAELMAIASASKEELQACVGEPKLPLHVLYEGEPGPKDRPFSDRPHLFVADRFGEIKMMSAVSMQVVDEVFDRAITALELIELECPECGVPTWSI